MNRWTDLIKKSLKYPKASIIVGVCILFSKGLTAQQVSDSLRIKAAQMLLIGFRGTDAEKENLPILKDIRDLQIGGVILFEYDAPTKSRPRNVVSPQQLKKLIARLQSEAKLPIWVSIDQEGGAVNRLKAHYGFPAFPSPQAIAAMKNLDSTRVYAKLTASTLASLGFNLNFAPGVDLNSNPKNPIIGKIGRSFSDDPQEVIRQARTWIQIQKEEKIISCIKHFPGHGSSKDDTHLGIADVTKTWNSNELLPYKALINEGIVEMVMTSHVFNANLDKQYPATLSENIIGGMLREQLHFEGVVVTDDLAMGAMVSHYSLDTIIKRSILAGADLLCLSNNGTSYDSQIAQKALDIIVDLVKKGELSEERINQSYQKLVALKHTILDF